MEEDSPAKVWLQVQRLEALAEFSTLLTLKLGDQELFLATSDFLRKTVQPDFAAIALYDESISQLRAYALDFEIARRVVGAEVKVPVTEEAWGPAFLNAETIVYDRERLSASHSSYLTQLLEAGIQSLACFPLTTPKGTLGTFNLGWRRDRASDGRGHFLETFCVPSRQCFGQRRSLSRDLQAFGQVAAGKAESRERDPINPEFR